MRRVISFTNDAHFVMLGIADGRGSFLEYISPEMATVIRWLARSGFAHFILSLLINLGDGIGREISEISADTQRILSEVSEIIFSWPFLSRFLLQYMGKFGK